MGTGPYCRFGHVDLFQIVELHNSMSREGSKTDMLQPPIYVYFVVPERKNLLKTGIEAGIGNVTVRFLKIAELWFTY